MVSKQIIAELIECLHNNKLGDFIKKNAFSKRDKERLFCKSIHYLDTGSDPDIIVRLYRSLNNVDITVDDNYALKVAIQKRYTIVSQWLLNNGVSFPMNDDDVCVNSDFVKACREQQDIEHIKERFSDTTSSEEIQAALLEACKDCGDNSLELVNFLISQGATATVKELIQVCKYGNDFELLEYLVDECKVDVTGRENEALIEASKYGNIDTVKYLVFKGADVTTRDNEAIMQAWKNGSNKDLVEYLISEGADITAQEDEVLIETSKRGTVDEIEYLVSLGADITAQNNQALINAVAYGNKEIVDYLLNHGADICAQENLVLVKAVQRRDINLVKYLIEKGADMEAKGEEVMDIVFDNLDIELMKELCDMADEMDKDFGFGDKNRNLEKMWTAQEEMIDEWREVKMRRMNDMKSR